MIVTGHVDKFVRLWDVRSGECIPLGDFHTGQVTSVVYSPDNRTILSSARDNTLKLIDTRMHQVLQTFTHEDYCSGANWNSATFSPGAEFVASGSVDGRVFVWNSLNSKIESVLKSRDSVVFASAWCPSGELLASADKTGIITLWV
jgi:WD40 repeat protein